MGLDARVYCNCFETGRLRTSPPFEVKLHVDRDGSLAWESGSHDVNVAMDIWLHRDACEHENGVVLHRRLGDFARIELLESELRTWEDDFPVLLSTVLSDGSRAGWHLGLDDVAAVAKELKMLEKYESDDPESQAKVDEFHRQMKDLVEAAMSMGKPIAF